MDTAEIEVFLVLAEELHFGRTAERLRMPQPRVSRLVAALEHRTGGVLFERTSRRVRLTPLGEQHRARQRPDPGPGRDRPVHGQTSIDWLTARSDANSAVDRPAR
jgi:hypothetical protein